MSDKQFFKHVQKLAREVQDTLQQEELRVDYICPILRSGAVPATYIANTLNIVKMAPIQIKIIEGKKDPQILLDSLGLIKTSRKNLVFLLVDATYGSGSTAKAATDLIKQHFPNATIIFACIACRKTSPRPNNIDTLLYSLSLKDNELPLYPWEIMENEKNHPDDLPENIFY